MWRMGIVWALRAVVVLFCPAVLLLVVLHPDWAVDAVGSGVPLVSGSAVFLMVKIGPLHQCPGRHIRSSVLQAAVDENRHRLDQYDGWFSALGINPAERARKRELRLLQGGGDTDPGRRVSLRR